MKPSPLHLLALGVALATTATINFARDDAPIPAFRIRADLSAPLNADHGWAGGINERATVSADRPFRLRLEVEQPSESTGSEWYRLQYRRNGNAWTAAEAHDFPYPNRDLKLEFSADDIGTAPRGWTLLPNKGAAAVTADGPIKILRVRTDGDPLVGTHTPLWPVREFGIRFRVPSADAPGLGLLFNDVDARNHLRVSVNPAAASVRVSRFFDGRESVIAERKATVAANKWLDLEVQVEGRTMEVNFADGGTEFTAELGAAIPESQVGFQIPAAATVDIQQFSVSGVPATPRASIVSSAAYKHGAATTDLLAGSAMPFQAGAGVSLLERIPANSTRGHAEFEWPVVVRRFADGAVTNEENDVFDFRMVDAAGLPLKAAQPSVRLSIPPGHVGGTFVETPGRIGPWQAGNGDLYFIMEPAETHNVFMMMKSSDGGRTWREVDAANRPRTGDLESVDARQVGNTIHIFHQVTRSVRYHAFRTSDHPTLPDTWGTRDEFAARVDSVAQGATLAVRSDGSMVAFYVGSTIHSSIRTPQGIWSLDTPIDAEPNLRSAGPKAILGARDRVHLAYYGLDGTVWYRRLQPDGMLTPRQMLASGLSTTRAEFGAVLPLVYIAATDTVVVLYRQADGALWERRIIAEGTPTPARRVTDRVVLQQAVDSQQPEADAVSDGDTVRVLFMEESSRSLFSTHDQNGWQASQLQVSGIQGSWVRGNIYGRTDGAIVYGYIYDAGSRGGAGMNRFAELVLRPAP